MGSILELPNGGQRLFYALSALPSLEFGRQGAIALATILSMTNPSDKVDLLVRRAVLDKTLDSNMTQGADVERLRMHPLLRALAEPHFRQWTQQQQDIAAQALATHYASYIQKIPDSAIRSDESNIIGSLVWASTHSQLDLM